MLTALFIALFVLFFLFFKGLQMFFSGGFETFVTLPHVEQRQMGISKLALAFEEFASVVKMIMTLCCR